ncbi:putative toxin-antitoxin system toxin component, PIN family [Xenophilus arseniciresistens]|uniref:Toxin-antitoxin system toxin component, PIN family n=1 Tax=Xenophilus arseniciresistens TaxID=1283306 RepID=A0AAE3SZP5_9BURK|nr:putative toxin-antitoxin system toxin component, PIN family [Xenophilus arseniciresistens]MDA7416091.1 putative toxin-antitoxin system toxin component, PIN family [Xenophilus arseniciresistens]
MTERLAGSGRWVVDTNVLIGRAFWPAGTAGRAVSQATQLGGKLLMSAATLGELHDVLHRPRFDRFASAQTRREFLEYLAPLLELIHPATPIRACRDPKDDKFLDVAVHGQADALITGDADLLALHPFHGLPILSPTDFLQYLGEDPSEAPGHRVQEGPPPRYRGSGFAPLPARLAAFLRARHGLDAPSP